MNNRARREKTAPSVYLSRARYAELEEELRFLETVWREEMTEKLKSSPPSGMGRTIMDPVREEQALKEGRITELRAKLSIARIIEEEWEYSDPDIVGIGSTVTVIDLEDGTRTTYVLVGSDEIDVDKGKISFLSPIGRTLLGRRTGECLEIVTPSGRLKYRIERVARLPL